MKALTAALLAAFLLATSVAFGANSATERTALPIYIGGEGPVRPVSVSIDTTGADLTVNDPPSDRMACIVGAFGAETNAANITIKSGSTTYSVPELAASTLVNVPLGNGPLFCTQPGEDLVIQSSAVYSSLLLYIIEAKKLILK